MIEEKYTDMLTLYANEKTMKTHCVNNLVAQKQLKTPHDQEERKWFFLYAFASIISIFGSEALVKGNNKKLKIVFLFFLTLLSNLHETLFIR